VTVKQKILEILIGQCNFISKSFFKIYQHGTKFDVCQPKSSRDIEWTVYRHVLFDRKIDRGHALITMYQWTKFDVCQAKGSQDVGGSVYLTSKWIRVIDTFKSYQVWCLSSIDFSRYWVDSIFLYPIWSWTSKSVGVICFKGCTSVPWLVRCQLVRCLSKKGFSKHLEDSIFLCPV
jgi:hypothetical protein